MGITEIKNWMAIHPYLSIFIAIFIIFIIVLFAVGFTKGGWQNTGSGNKPTVTQDDTTTPQGGNSLSDGGIPIGNSLPTASTGDVTVVVSPANSNPKTLGPLFNTLGTTMKRFWKGEATQVDVDLIVDNIIALLKNTKNVDISVPFKIYLDKTNNYFNVFKITKPNKTLQMKNMIITIESQSAIIANMLGISPGNLNTYAFYLRDLADKIVYGIDISSPMSAFPVYGDKIMNEIFPSNFISKFIDKFL